MVIKTIGEMINSGKEYILCAAIWYKNLPDALNNCVNITQGIVLCGHRHGHIISQLKSLANKRSVLADVGEYEQGFLTSKNRFVDRNEAGFIALQAGQIDKPTKNLFSEDIY